MAKKWNLKKLNKLYSVYIENKKFIDKNIDNE